VLATSEDDRLGETAGPIVGGVGLTVAAIAGFYLVVPLLVAIGHARLVSGIGVIARWHVTAAEWDRFRAFDAIRARQGHTLVNDLWIRRRTPARGVEVIVGRRQLIVDGSYHALRPRGLPELRAVFWLSAVADPDCLEFAVVYPAGRHGGTRQLSLRVPVPVSARETGMRVFEHFRSIIPERRPGIAYRRPGLVIGWCIALALVAAAAGLLGWTMYHRGDRSELPIILAITGLMTATGALILAAIIALVMVLQKKQ
jgi:hypothetical protein